jgi:hypothetical protein
VRDLREWTPIQMGVRNTVVARECEVGAVWYDGITIGVGGGWCSVMILGAARCRRDLRE